MCVKRNDSHEIIKTRQLEIGLNYLEQNLNALRINTMKKLVTSLLFFVFVMSLQAQDDLEMTFANAQITNDGVNDFYEVDVYISSTSEFLLGIGQFYFTYNTAAFGDTPQLDGRFSFEQPAGSILDEGIEATHLAKFYGGFASAQNTVGRISVNWNQVFAASTKNGNNITSTAKLLCHLKLQYLDAAEHPLVCFEQDPLFDDFNSKACGPYVSGNPFETANCTLFPAVPVTEDNYDCTGATIDPSSCAGGTTTWAADSWDNGFPDATMEVIIASDYDTNEANFSACSLTVNPGAVLTIRPDNFLLIENDIQVDGSLIVWPTGNLVQVNNDAQVINNGTINVNIVTPVLQTRDFMVMGSPMTAETRNGVFGSAFLVLDSDANNFIPHPSVPAGGTNFADDNNNYWSIMNAGTHNPGEGYIVRPQDSYTDPANETYSFTYEQGTLNNGIVSRAIVYNGPTNNPDGTPNALANPYASAISADDLINNNSLINEMYFWEHLTPPGTGIPGAGSMNFSMDDISMYNLSGGVAASNDPTGIDTAPNGIISTGQGFGIKAFGTGNISFNNGMRRTSGNSTLRNPDDIDRVWLQVNSLEYELGSNTLIAFNSNASQSLDPGYDSNRLASVVSLYSHLEDGSEQLGIQTREAFASGIKIPMGFASQVDANSTYTISIANMEGNAVLNASIYLIDHELNTVTNLKDEDYYFESRKGSFHQRFTLLFELNPVLGDAQASLEEVSLFPNPTKDLVMIKSPVVLKAANLYDISGRVIGTYTFENSDSYQIDMSTLPSAIYLLKIISENGSVNKRIIKE